MNGIYDMDIINAQYYVPKYLQKMKAFFQIQWCNKRCITNLLDIDYKFPSNVKYVCFLQWKFNYVFLLKILYVLFCKNKSMLQSSDKILSLLTSTPLKTYAHNKAVTNRNTLFHTQISF